MLLRPWRNAASTCEEAAREPLRRYPITGIGCRCARVTPGQATAAPPSSVMNVRRLMGLSLQPHSASRGYHIRGDACCASQQISATHVGCGSKAERLAVSIFGLDYSQEQTSPRHSRISENLHMS